MNKIILIILTLILLVFSGCSSTNINTNPIDENNNAVAVSDQSDFWLELSEKKFPQYSYVHKFGRNPDIDTASGFESIWNGGGDYTGFPNVSETMEIFSSSGSDTYGGAGAWTIRIMGLLNSSCEEVPDVYVNLSGTTPVSLGATPYYRGNRMKVVTGNVNIGTITLRHTTTTANIFAVMPIGYGSTMISAYTIPANHLGFFQNWYASLSGKFEGNSEVRLMYRPNGGVWQVKEELSIMGAGNSYIQRTYTTPKNSLEGCGDVQIKADSSIDNLGVAAGFDIIIEDESHIE